VNIKILHGGNPRRAGTRKPRDQSESQQNFKYSLALQVRSIGDQQLYKSQSEAVTIRTRTNIKGKRNIIDLTLIKL